MDARNSEDEEANIPLMENSGSLRNEQFDRSMDGMRSENEEAYMPLMESRGTSRNERFISPPPLFPSVLALNGAASYLADTTSYLSRCFPNFSEPSPRDLPRQEMILLSSQRMTRSLAVTPRLLESGNVPAIVPLVDGEALSPTNGDTTENTNEADQLIQSSQGGNSIFQGLIERARKTVRGSADDIGWLQRDPQMPPVEDGTERFMEIIGDIRHGLHKLPNTMIYLLIPGLFSNHGPLYFVHTKKYFSKLGLTCHIAKIHSEASVETNARELREYIDELYWGSGKQILLLGHSKGGVDAAAALSMYWPDLKDKVAGLALAQSPYGGSPIASDLLRKGIGDYVNSRKIMEILICNIMKGDIRALEDLTHEKRKEFLRRNPLPKEVPIVSLHTEASLSPAVLATLTRVAHAELPMIAPLSSATQPPKLPVLIPLGGAMAACAQLLQMRYGAKSDGLVACSDAEVPGSVVVRPKRKLDHCWMVYSSLKDDPLEPDSSQVCEALLELLVEVGERKKHEHE